MMLPELDELRGSRKKLGLTQSELSKSTGVSQSLIAKIEAGSIVPSYANAKRLFDFFETIQKASDAKAEEVMTRKVISAGREDTLKKAIRLMEKNSVSQLPVIEDGKSIGTLSEKNCLDVISAAGNSEEILERPVEKIMEEAMPQISAETPFEVVSSLMAHYPGALVVRQGKIEGIITKSDLLKAIVAKKAKT